MLKKILLLTLLLGAFQSKCLNNEILQKMGLHPLDNPIKLENPQICTEIFKTERSCVEVEHLALFLNNLYNYVYFKDSAVIASVYDDIKDLSGKAQREPFYSSSNKIIVDEKNKFKKASSTSHNIEISSQELVDLKNSIIGLQDSCLNSQLKFTLGTFCILASEKASEFVQGNESKKKIKMIENKKEKANSLILKVEKSTSDYVFEQCLPLLKGMCVSSQSEIITKKSKMSKVVFHEKSGCSNELYQCKDSLSCSLEIKKKVFGKFFGAFGFKFGHSAFFEGPGNPELNEIGGWYQKLKEFIYYSAQKIKMFAMYTLSLISEENCPNLTPFEDLEYQISEEGRDFVRDGENSGVYKEYPEVLFVGTGFCFIVLQLFV